MEEERVIDIGGIAWDDEPYEGPVLVSFAIDPGMATGWSALKVPVGLVSGLGVARTLVRCRRRHGTILRSGGLLGVGAGATFNRTDGRHVTSILEVARTIFEDWVEDEDGEPDPDTQFIFVMESFTLRMLDMDPALLAPVRVGAVFMDRLEQSESPTRVFFQSPGDAKQVVTDDRLKRWGFYDEHSGPHARDADRHNILMLRKFAESGDVRRRIFGYDPLSPLSSSSS
jgi:hypothetical protein